MACNVDIKDMKIGDGIELGSKFARQISLVSIIQSMEADLSKIADMVMNYDNAAPDSVLRNLQEVQVPLESMADQTTDHITSLNAILQGLAQTDSMIVVVKQGAIDDLPDVFQSVSNIRQEISQIFGTQVPELLTVVKSLE